MPAKEAGGADATGFGNSRDRVHGTRDSAKTAYDL